MFECTALQNGKEPEALQDDFISGRAPYAMAYVRMQKWERLFRAQEALQRGTAFPALVKPFMVKEAAR